MLFILEVIYYLKPSIQMENPMINDIKTLISFVNPPEVKSEPQSENSNPLKRKHPEEKKTKNEPIKKHKSTDTINDKKWNENFEEVRRFHEKHGRWPKQKEGALGKWCAHQRQAKKGKGTNRVSPARIAKLDGIGFDWGSTMTAEQRWDENFEAVRRFRDVHGRWPPRSEGALGEWCGKQRQAKKGKGHNRISPAQIAKLDGIGFDWGSTMAGTPEQQWDENFEEVRRFRHEHGRWPKQSEGALGVWCHTQRQAKKGNGHNRTSETQVTKLDAIGFAWGSAMTAEERWDGNFEAVRRFRDEHGRWPKAKEGALGEWCNKQRQAKKGNGHNRISETQVTKLDAIGFAWARP
jgi:hypothetical protein